jgi:hypothetical protein
VLTSPVQGAIEPQQAAVHTDARAAYRALGKMGRGSFHGVSPKHRQRYLNEFVFRFNQRWQEADLFSPVLHGAIAADPLPCQHLTAERTG